VHYYLLLQRNEGRMRARWQIGAAKGVFGELRVSEQRDTVLRRHTIVARLLDVDAPSKDLVPPLIDATLLYVDTLRMVLCGFEQIDTRAYSQTWMLAVDEGSLHSLS
jgi:hypothetical protein